MSKVLITTTVDWDAFDRPDRSVFDNGLAAIENFNKSYPHVKLTHFICAAYFTRDRTATKHYKAAIQALRRKRPQDEFGLHVHCWKSLMKHCGVPQKVNPTYHHYTPHKDARPTVQVFSKEDTGHGVPLGAYNRQQILRILQKSLALLESNQIVARGEVQSFRCGGWMACDTVLQALGDAGVKYDASAADAKLMGDINPDLKKISGDHFKLGDWITKLWGPTLSRTFAYTRNDRLIRAAYPKGIQIYDKSSAKMKLGLIAAQPKRIGKVVEIPNTALLADYVTEAQMKQQIETAMALTVFPNAPRIHVSIGFHIESATWLGIDRNTNITKIENTIKWLDGRFGGKIEYPTVKEVGAVGWS